MARRRVHSPDQSARSSHRGPIKELDYDKDAVNTESQQMLALASLLKKPKTDDKEVQQFRARVTTDRERLKIRLNERVRQAEEAETHRRNEIASAILDALKASNRRVQGEPTTFAGTKIARNEIYEPVKDVLSSSEALLKEYERMDKMIVNMREEQAQPVAETWHQDLQETEEKLRMGARVAVRNVKKVLGADIENNGEGAGGAGDMEMQDSGDEQELNYELQKSLRYAERGVKRMVKGLPSGDIE